MNFGFPQFFWALLALSIPILIHLFNLRRPKTVFFSNTRFLKQLEEQRKSVKRLRYWLILSLRSLALAALVTAFTLPYQKEENQIDARETFLHIYIDNSLSMQGEGNEGSLLNQARLYTKDLLNSLGDGVQVQLIANDFKPRYQAYYSNLEAGDLVREISLSSSHRSLEEVLQRFRNLSERNPNAKHQYLLISDFQNSIFNKDSLSLAANESVQVLQLKKSRALQNAAIDSIQFAAPVFVPGLDQELSVFIRNYSNQKLQSVNLAFYLNDTLRNTQVIDLEPNMLNEAKLSFSPPKAGSYRARLEIDKGAPEFDNNFYFSFQTLKRQKVYLLSEFENSDLPLKIFDNDYFQLVKDEPENLDYDYLKDCRLILLQSDMELSESLNQQLKKHLQKGKNIWFFPGSDAQVYQSNLSQFGLEISKTWIKDSIMAQDLNSQDPFLAKTFIPSRQKPILPYSKSYLKSKDQSAISLLEVNPNLPLLSRISYEGGQLFYASTSLAAENSNLGSHPILIPLLANASFFAGDAPKSYIRSGVREDFQSIEAPQLEEALVLNTEEGELIPLQQFKGDRYQLSLYGKELDAGSYRVSRNGEDLAWLSVNCNPKESDLLEVENVADRFMPSAEVLDIESKSDSNNLRAGILNESNPLWPWFLALALLFLVLEMLFLKSKFRRS